MYGWKIIFDRTLPDKWVIDDNLEIIFSTNNFYKYNMDFFFFFKYNYEIPRHFEGVTKHFFFIRAWKPLPSKL